MSVKKIWDDPSRPIFMAGPWVTDHDIKIVEDALRHWYDDCYHYVETFQKEFAEYHGRKYALMTPNCTSSIHLLLTALGIKDDDEVIVPECTWIATAAPITYLRATPVFCDIEPENWCLDPESVRRSITPRTKAIIAVDLYGNMPSLDALQNIAHEHGIPLIEDAAESLGSSYRGVRAGKFGIGSVFSFHRTKTITTGEGGMLLLDDDALYERCAFLRDHGRSKDAHYWNLEVTYKYMPSNVQAALGYAQFKRLDELVARKRELFRMYKERLQDINGIQFNAEPEGVFNSVWLTALVFDRSLGIAKKDAMETLEKMGIPSRPFFYPLSSMPAYPGFKARYRVRNPVAYDISSRGINLSCAMNLATDQVDAICAGVRTLCKR